MRRMIHYVFILLGLSLVLFSLGLYFGHIYLTADVTIPKKHRIVVVSKGESLHHLARRLQKNKLITWPKLWVKYAQVVGQTQLYTGEYALSETETPLTLLEKLQSNKVVQHDVIFVEGLRAQDIIYRLTQHEKLTQLLPNKVDAASLKRWGIDIQHLEGWFYPDTYFFSAGDSDISILKRSYQKMQKVLAEEWQNREKNLPLKNAYEALILASIIEKETGAAHERKEIAGVFIRRLNLGMRLQTDPTVIYGLGDDFDGDIKRSHLRTPTAYNTYTIKGLPPTPIALVGREAIHAALHPADGESLYFVAKGDGTHQFSSTLDAHQKAVEEYQLKRKKHYRSSIKK